MTICNYFPLLDSTNSHYQRPFKPYSFIDRGAHSLVVSVGASWTWGNFLPANFTQDTTSQELHQYRIDNIYGNQIAQELNADFLNLAANGASNFWAADRICDLLNIVDQFNYKKIYVIWTTTDPGKGFNSHEDCDVDYNEIFSNINSYNQLLQRLNQQALDKVLPRICNNKKIIFRIGSDRVDYIGLDAAKSNLLPMPWALSMPVTQQLNLPICYIADGAAIDRLDTALNDFNVDRTGYKKWLSDLIDKLSQRADYLHRYAEDLFPLNTGQHPNHRAHQLWAEIVLNTL